MKILLVNPPTYVKLSGMTSVRPSFPLGLAYIASTLRASGHEVTVLDAIGMAPDQFSPEDRFQCLGLRLDEVANHIDPSVDAIGITLNYSFAWRLVRRMIREIKRRHPDKILIGGGEHFTALPELSLKEAPMDVLVLGEGEETAQELFRAMEKGETDFGSIDGVAFRKDGQVIQTPRRKRIRDVDSIPWPAWDLFDLEAYNRQKLTVSLHSGMTVPILATRGCPYACTFCSASSMWMRRWIARNPHDVTDEIQHYHEAYGAQNFPFQDLTAILQRDWIVAFCNELLKRKLKITWLLPVGTRCEILDDEVARLMRMTGGSSTAFGPESGSARTRHLVKKRMSEETLMKAVEASVNNGLNITIYLVVGFPSDTWADLRETMRMVRKLGIAGADDLGIAFFFPLPGTELCRELEAKGKIVISDDFLELPIHGSRFSILEEHNYCEVLNARELTLAKWLIILNFYGVSFLSHPSKVFRILWHVIHGRETTRLEAFLGDQKKKGMISLRGRLQRLFARSV